VDLPDANHTVLPCRRVELLIALVDLLKVILGRLQVILSWFPMTDQSLPIAIAGKSLGVLLRLRSSTIAIDADSIIIPAKIERMVSSF
jgi:hypothetical protein